MTDKAEPRTDWAWCYENPKEAAAQIDRLLDVVEKCRFRLFGAGPSTDPLYAEIGQAIE